MASIYILKSCLFSLYCNHTISQYPRLLLRNLYAFPRNDALLIHTLNGQPRLDERVRPLDPDHSLVPVSNPPAASFSPPSPDLLTSIPRRPPLTMNHSLPLPTSRSPSATLPSTTEPATKSASATSTSATCTSSNSMPGRILANGANTFAIARGSTPR